MKMVDGTVYEGEFKNDVFHGKGKIMFKTQKKDEKGVIFEGKFSFGKQE
jgi:hypothetical protein